MLRWLAGWLTNQPLNQAVPGTVAGIARRATGSGAPRRGAAVMDRMQVSCQFLQICNPPTPRVIAADPIPWVVIHLFAYIGPNLAPNSAQNPPKSRQKSIPNRILFFSAFLSDF